MKDWRNIVVEPTLSFKKAIERLDAGALRIVLVADQQYKLCGTLTDGDVRRALLNHVSLEAPVSEVMCQSPISVKQGTEREKIVSLMHRQGLLHIPVLDEDSKIIGLHNISEYFSAPRYDNLVFLMAGGFGTRLRPLTDECPKPMLKLGGKPILELIMKSFIRAGYYRFVISTHYLAEQIVSYFGDGSQWGVEIEYVHEDQPLGTAGSLSLLDKTKVDKPFFVMNGDLLTDVDFSLLSDFHHQCGGFATMCVREYSQQVPYGVIKHQDKLITEIEEKPIEKYFVNAGIYMLSPDIFDFVTGQQYLDMPNLLSSVISDQSNVNMFPLHEYWLDIGRMNDFQKAQEEYSSHGFS